MSNDDKCSVAFKVEDYLSEDMTYLKKKATQIAYLVYNEPNLITLLKEFLLNFINNEIYFEEHYKEWKKRLSPAKKLYGKELVEDFSEKLYNAYKTVKSFHIEKFRGLVFENLMEIYYRNICKNNASEFSHGCKVIINGNDIIYICEEDQECNRKTIDIAVYNKTKSKFYELKVGPTGFDAHVINYLNILNDKACSGQISDSVTVGCMTLKEKEHLALQLKFNRLDFEKLELNGIEEIKELFIHKAS